MNKRKFISLFLSILIFLMIVACSPNMQPKKTTLTSNQHILSVQNTLAESSTLSEKEQTSKSTNSKFEVHYIDVGQADASLVLCDDKSMLIDGGNPEDSSLIVAYLKKQNIKHLDYIICTHAHADHVGGLSGALSVFPVGSVYAPKTENDIKAYINFKSKVASQGLIIQNPIHGNTISHGSSEITFLGPIYENVDDINDTSIVLKIIYGKTSFLFTGDAEHDEEQSILSKNYDLSSTVLKVGHHGSKDSTTYPFLREIMPEYAIISVGENSYGHPSEEALSRLSDAEVEVYRTDLHGDIIVTSNGESVSIKTSKTPNQSLSATTNEATPVPSVGSSNQNYIGNKKSKKFHIISCHSLPAEKNRIYFNSRDEAILNNYSPCKNCCP